MSSLVKMYYEVHGREGAPPLLCIHGFGASLYSWRNFVGDGWAVSGEYRVFTIDLKGCGKSPKVYGNDYSIQDHANLIYEFIHEHDLKNLSLIGNSFGGALTLLLSLMFYDHDPDRLKSVVLIDAGAYADLIPFYLKILSWPMIGFTVSRIVPSRFAAVGVLRQAYYQPKKNTKRKRNNYNAPRP